MIYGSLSRDYVKFYDETNSNQKYSVLLDFVLGSKGSIDNFDGILGIQYIDLDGIDLITRLYNEKMINKNLFSIFFKSPSDQDGTLLLGEHPTINQSKEKQIDCDLKYSSGWICSSKGLIYKNNYMEFQSSLSKAQFFTSSYDLMFDTGSSHIICSKDYYDYIKNKIFGDYYITGQCYERGGGKMTFFYCRESVINSKLIGDLRIVLNSKENQYESNSVTIKKEDLFELSETTNEYMSIFVLGDKESIETIIGIKVLKGYITIFDKEMKKMRFIENDNKIEDRSSNINRKDGIYDFKEIQKIEEEVMKKASKGIYSSTEKGIIMNMINTYKQNLIGFGLNGSNKENLVNLKMLIEKRIK